MVERVVLHIGTMKSGTTYLQRVLASGVLEPASGFYAGGSYGIQTKAVTSLLRQGPGRRPQAWQDLAGRVRARDGVAVYSHEFLSFARRDRAREVVESFGRCPVDVVLTVRDQRRAVPAQWQTYVRHHGEDAWATYLRRLDRLRESASGQPGRALAVRTFRRAQNVPGILARWSGLRRVSSVGVLVLPAPGAPPQQLWQRFCEVARLPYAEPPTAAVRHNESLGYASCDLLRRLNPELSGLTGQEYGHAVKAPLQALLPLRPDEQRPVLDRAGGELARELNRRILEAVDQQGVRLVGDRDELPVEEDGAPPASVPPPDPDELRRAAETAWSSSVPGVATPSGDVDEVVAELGRRLAVRFGT